MYIDSFCNDGDGGSGAPHAAGLFSRPALNRVPPAPASVVKLRRHRNQSTLSCTAAVTRAEALFAFELIRA
ncbi:hypothetical protein EVAR_85375_1 [Eumeta japonica]|uniref:Uncharacterized protein n=1 Tax=Eumeta variegata TaxID=151549 RepID=A0A4C1WTY2_EUMVA|nr:hypothetical protein EVAR_85375_1 [Eumeta japonica]